MYWNTLKNTYEKKEITHSLYVSSIFQIWATSSSIHMFVYFVYLFIFFISPSFSTFSISISMDAREKGKKIVEKSEQRETKAHIFNEAPGIMAKMKGMNSAKKKKKKKILSFWSEWNIVINCRYSILLLLHSRILVRLWCKNVKMLFLMVVREFLKRINWCWFFSFNRKREKKTGCQLWR